MTHILRPISTVTDQGNYTGSTAHGSVDGDSPDTGDYWNGNDNETDVLEVLLTDLSSDLPGDGTCTVVIYEAQADTDSAPSSGGTAPTFDLEVYQGAVQKASVTGVTPTESAFTVYNTLTFNTSVISDWSDVRVRFTSNGSGGGASTRRGAAVSYIAIDTPRDGGPWDRTVDWDFANDQSLTDSVSSIALTFTRASTATYRDSNGYLAEAAIDTPRYHYDSGGTCRGLLLEPGPMSNDITDDPEDFTATGGWFATHATVTSNQNTDPKNTATAADTLADDNGGDSQSPNISSAEVLSTSREYTFSCFFKYIDCQWVWLDFKSFTGISGNAWFDIQNGVVGATEADVLASGIDAYANGWYRCWQTCAVETDGTGGLYIGLANADSGYNYTTDGRSVALWGAQLETVEVANAPQNYGPSSYHAGTRSQDNLTTTTMTWFDDAAPHLSFFYEAWNEHKYFTNLNAFFWNLDTPSASADVQFGMTSGLYGWWTVNNNNVSVDDGACTEVADLHANTPGTIRYAGTVSQNDMRLSANGATIVTDTTVGYPIDVGVTELEFRSSSGSGELGACVSRMIFYDEPLPDSRMDDYTTNGVPGDIEILPAAKALTVTPQAPTVTVVVDVDVTPAATALTVTPQAPTVTYDAELTPAAVALTVTPQAPTVSLDVAVAPAAKALTVTPLTPTVSLDVGVAPPAKALTVTPLVPAVSLDVAVAPAAKALTVTSQAPTVSLDVGVTPAAKALTVTPLAPTVTIVAGSVKTYSKTFTCFRQNAVMGICHGDYTGKVVVNDVEVLPAAQALVITPLAPTVAYDIEILPAAKALTVTPLTPTVEYDIEILPTAQALTVTPQTPTVSLDVAVTPAAQALTVTPQTPTVAYDIEILPPAKALTVTPLTPTVAYDIEILPSAVSLTLALSTPTVIAGAEKSYTGQKTRHAQHAYAAILLGSFVGKTPSVLYYQNVGGSLTPTGVFAQRFISSARVGGTLTPAGSVAKHTTKLFSGSVTPTGAVIKQTQKDGLAGALSPGGAVIKETQKVLAGDVTPGGDTTPSPLYSQATTGTLTPIGALAQLFIEGIPGIYKRARRFLSHVYRVGRRR